MPKHVYGISSMAEAGMGTLYLHPFSAREKATGNITFHTVPWPINGTITSVEAEIGTALQGTDIDLSSAPVSISIYKNEVIEATTTIQLVTFESRVTKTVSISVSAGDRISVELSQTTGGITWRGFINARFIFDTLFRGMVIGGGTGEDSISGSGIYGSETGRVQRTYPSLSDIDVIVGGSGIIRSTIFNDSTLSNFYVYRQPSSTGANFVLKIDENPTLEVTLSGSATQDVDIGYTEITAGSYMGVDITVSSGLVQMSWSALLRSDY